MKKEQILEAFQQLLDEKPVEYITIDKTEFIDKMDELISTAKEDVEYCEEVKFTSLLIENQGYLRGLMAALEHFNFIYE